MQVSFRINNTLYSYDPDIPVPIFRQSGYQASEVWRDLENIPYLGEEWIPVSDSDVYQVSSYGRVRNESYLLKQNMSHTGYLTITLTLSGVRTKIPVHVLVVREFCPNQYRPSLTVNHRNEDKCDNRLVNLEFMTRAENNRYGTHSAQVRFTHIARGYYENRCKSVLCIETSQIYNNAKQAAILLGFPDVESASAGIRRCCNNRSSSFGGYHFKYSE